MNCQNLPVILVENSKVVELEIAVKGSVDVSKIDGQAVFGLDLLGSLLKGTNSDGGENPEFSGDDDGDENESQD